MFWGTEVQKGEVTEMELHKLYYSPDINRMIESGRMIYTHV
jgi:hypothetical protein